LWLPTGPLGADFIAKIGEEKLATKDAQQSGRDKWTFESIFRIGG
jgi:hypothetical protein